MKTKTKKTKYKSRSLAGIVFKNQASMLVTSVVVVVVLVGITSLFYWASGDYLQTKIIPPGGYVDPYKPNQYFNCRSVECGGVDPNTGNARGRCPVCKTFINDGKCIYSGTASKDITGKVATLSRGERYLPAPGSCNPGYCMVMNHIIPNPNYPFSSVDADGWPKLTVPPLQCPSTPQPATPMPTSMRPTVKPTSATFDGMVKNPMSVPTRVTATQRPVVTIPIPARPWYYGILHFF